MTLVRSGTDSLDTNPTTRAAYLAFVQRLSPAERFVRALSLSAFVRQLAWQGAVRHSGSLGHAATVDRFLTQLYGADIATAFRAANAPNDE